MKNKAHALLKKITSILGAIAKAKSMAVKTKFSATKARLLMLSMVKSKKSLMDSLSQKIHQIMARSEDDDNKGAIVLYDANANASEYHLSSSMQIMQAQEEEEEDNDDKYPDLRHSLFEEEDDDYEIDEEKLKAAGGSIIDMMRNCKEEGEEFKLEEEIDHAADLFIMRFRKQIRLQKLDSFKRLQEMLARAT